MPASPVYPEPRGSHFSPICVPCLSPELTTVHRPAPTLSGLLPTIALSPLAATLMDLYASVANKRLTAQLSPLNATLTKNRWGWGCYGLPGRTSIPVRCPDLSLLFPTLTKTAGCVAKTSHSGRGCTPNVQTFNLQTFKRSSRPIAAERPWCHNWQRHENSSRSGETTLLPPVSKITRADFGNRSRPLPVTDSDSIGVASRA